MMNNIKKGMTAILITIAVMLWSSHSCFAAVSVTAEPSSTGFIASVEHRIVEFVSNTVSHLRYTTYELGGTHFDSSRGIYILDCSSYVDQILKRATPRAYSKLVAASGSIKPTSLEYYNFFVGLPRNAKRHWNKIENVAQLRPGDILVFRYKNHHQRSSVGGHVMIVMKEPKRKAGAFSVRVADSASAAHSHDTRPAHQSGVGIGNLLLKVNPRTGQPYAYAWKEGSRWERNVKFAMGRPG
jgi:hypothetical protein